MADKLYHCEICNVHLTGPEAAVQHYSSAKHQRKSAALTATHTSPWLSNPVTDRVGVQEPTAADTASHEPRGDTDVTLSPASSSSRGSVAGAHGETVASYQYQTTTDTCARLTSPANIIMVPSVNPALPALPVSMTESLPQTEYDFDGDSGVCHLCQVRLTSQQHSHQHLAGKKHRKAKQRWEAQTQAQSTPAATAASVRCNMTGAEASEAGDSDRSPTTASSSSNTDSVAKHVSSVALQSQSSCIIDATTWFHCSTCNKYMNTAAQLELHRRSARHINRQTALHQQRQQQQHCVSADNTLWLTCPVCAKKLNSASQLEMHRASHWTGSPLPQPSSVADDDPATSSGQWQYCDVCSKRLNTLSQLEEHRLSPAHCKKVLQSSMGSQVDDTVWYTCRVCSKKLNSARQLDIHMNSHGLTDRSALGPLHSTAQTEAGSETLPLDTSNPAGMFADLSQLVDIMPQEQISSSSGNQTDRESTTSQPALTTQLAEKETLVTTAETESSGCAEPLTSSMDMATRLEAESLVAGVAGSEQQQASVQHTDIATALSLSQSQNSTQHPSSSAPADVPHAAAAADDDDKPICDDDLITTGCCDHVGCIYHCKLCDAHLYGDQPKYMHTTGARHISSREKAQQAVTVTVTAGESRGFRYHCQLCNVPLNTLRDKQQHERGQQHVARSMRSVPAVRRSRPPLLLPTADDLCSPASLVTSTPRAYQQELYSKSLLADSVCFLPTGTGKTLVAVMLMSRLLALNPHHSAVFVVDRVLLALQQSRLIRRELSQKYFHRWNEGLGEREIRKLRVAMLCGPKGDLQGASLADQDVIVITAAYYMNLLEAKSLHWTDNCLVVLDEVHHCIKDHPYSRLMQLSQTQCDGAQRPRLLGLTASPAGCLTAQATVAMLRQLMANLHLHTLITAQQHAKELDCYRSRTELEIRLVNYSNGEMELGHELRQYLVECYQQVYSLCDETSQCELDGLSFVQHRATVSSMHYDMVQCLSDAVDRLDAKDAASRLPLSCVTTHVKVISQAIATLDTDGLDSAYHELSILLQADYIGGFTRAKELRLECGRLEGMTAAYRDDRSGPTTAGRDDAEAMSTSPVFIQLVEELERWWDGQTEHDDQSQSQSESALALVLVRQRSKASVISKLVNSWPSLRQRGLSAVYVVGHGAGHHVGMTVTQQQRTLDQIVRGSYRVIVATSVAEEGFDLPDCDVVIQLDAADCVRALVQTRGRARKAHSHFITFCRDTDQQSQLQSLLLQERHMIDAVNQLVSCQSTL